MERALSAQVAALESHVLALRFASEPLVSMGAILMPDDIRGGTTPAIILRSLLPHLRELAEVYEVTEPGRKRAILFTR